MMIENKSAEGKGYDNPKHWGDDAEKGDIFQITEAEADANTVAFAALPITNRPQ
ncbi:hypothetical protein [Paraburkholderia humisilvae]|uniref:Uncharacterized protein n=1 Tax=Paraburkholderia humisilvae TaxID=627669 RepID=A0A6J5F9E5_9BURK|nr:hypothetical protein [Paraburkholderia humisilvae]CAB3775003.1 hypothetical protein LMG29542_08385 [Paraburkholderia humisilvae]